MWLRRRDLLKAALGGAFCAGGRVPACAEEYYIFTRPPRLFLGERRTRLLRRERERESMRWMQFQRLVEGGAALPEPGFAWSLYAVITGNAAWREKAVRWAQAEGKDPRQLAIVLDWLGGGMSEDARAAIARKLEPMVRQGDLKEPVGTVRNRVLASLALAEERKEQALDTLAWVIDKWWEERVVAVVKQRRNPFLRADHFAVVELLHALSDNLRVDLRETAKTYFKDFPVYHVAGHYPAPLAAGEGEYRIPVQKGSGEPDLRAAALSRAAGLALTAYDPNSLECQFLQGWLIQDRFMLNGPFGAPYEMLWANPYQPGLSYEHLPKSFYADVYEAMFLRSSWDEDALWVGYAGGELQLMQAGELRMLQLKELREPLSTGNAILASAAARREWRLEESEAMKVYLIGLKPLVRYDIEVDDEEVYEAQADSKGVLVLDVRGGPVGLRIGEAGGEPAASG